MGEFEDKAIAPEWLIRGYRSFRENDSVQNRERDQRLAREGQRPRALWVGCSDSRVIPERILDAGAGDVFVVRNVANIVPHADSASTSSGAAIEYAVQALGVQDAVVCGHESCGGIQALMQGAVPAEMPNLAQWIDYSGIQRIRNASAVQISGEDLERVIKANVLEQLGHLRSYVCVRKAEESGGLHLWGVYYSLETGGLEVYDPSAELWTPLG